MIASLLCLASIARAEDVHKSNQITAYSCSDDPKKPSKNPACDNKGNQRNGGAPGGGSGDYDIIYKLKQLFNQ